MVRDRNHQADAKTEATASPAQRASASSGLAEVQRVATQPGGAKAVAEVIATHPSDLDAIVMWLHQHLGQGFVQAVLATTHDKPRPASDGDILGADQRAYAPSTPVDDIPAFEPKGGKPKGNAMFVNGILVGPEREAGPHGSEAQKVADAFNLEVRPVYNASHGLVRDSLETVKDKLNISAEPTVHTLANSMLEQIKLGQEMTYIGHSQGASQICRAIHITTATLKKANPKATDADIAALLHTSLHVVTLAGAASRWPDGPRYDHYINTKDAIPNLLGVNSWFANGGAGAIYHRFSASSLRKTEGDLPAGDPNAMSGITNAANRSTHGLGLYTDVISGQPIKQADGTHPVPITDSDR